MKSLQGPVVQYVLVLFVELQSMMTKPMLIVCPTMFGPLSVYGSNLVDNANDVLYVCQSR